MAERTRSIKVVPEWLWWLLFAVNALLAIFYATVGREPLLAIVSAFTAGVALAHALTSPRLDRIDAADREIRQHLRRLGIVDEDPDA